MTALTELRGDSAGMIAVRAQIERLISRQATARRPAPILIEGETGTGKGLVARVIHRAGPRAAQPFVHVNCATIPPTIVEAELFGYERGAFTDARQSKPGLFQAAHRGVIFLDEIGLLPEALQSKLLTVIEERAVRRLGSTRDEPVDVLVISASNEDMTAAVSAGRFRTDLYHRLAVVTLSLPPLRERGDDVLLLADHFLAHVRDDYGLPALQFTRAARAAIAGHPWRGNVRELSNAIERAALLVETPTLTPDALGLASPRAEDTKAHAGAAPEWDTESERDRVLGALTGTGWNVSRAAAILGVPRHVVRYRIEKYGLSPQGARPLAIGARPAVNAGVLGVPAAGPSAATTAQVRWEERQIAVLRLDVDADTADLAADTRHIVERVIEKLQAFGGRVEEVSPRCVVAAFGLLPVEDGPRRAATTALAIHRELGQAAPAPPLKRTVAIDVATVLVRIGDGGVSIGLESKMAAWTALQELRAAAPAGTTIVSGAAASFLRRRFDLEPLPGALAGAYQLVGRESSGFGPPGSVGPFIGRRHELELLAQRFEQAASGQGQVVSVLGEAGIGKSRLLFEFRSRLGADKAAYLEGHCQSYGPEIPYLPVLEMLRASCRIAESDPPAVIGEKVVETLDGLALESPQAAPYLQRLLGVKAGSDALDALSPEVMQARTLDILRRMVLQASRQRPLILAVEDAHWIDPASRQFLDALVDVVPGARILIVLTYRPGHEAFAGGRSYATQLALPPLSAVDSRAVVQALMGEPLAEPLTDLILTRAEGNPFFLEELVHAVGAVEDGVAAVLVPHTIQGALRARIDQLSDAARHLLRIASVVGRVAPRVLLDALWDGEPMEAAVGELIAMELCYARFEPGDSAVVFRHALTQDVAYGATPETLRRALHARIVEALEGLGRERLADHVEHLARHALAGGVWSKAVLYARQAGNKAAGHSAYQEAGTWFEHALSALEHLEPTPGVREQGIDIRLELRDVHWALGQMTSGLRHLDTARTLAQSLGDEARLARVLGFTVSNSLVIGDTRTALETGRQLLAIPAVQADGRLQVVVNQFWGTLCYVLGDCAQGHEVFERNVELLRRARPGRFTEFYLVNALAFLTMLHTYRGEFAAALARASEAAELAREPHNVVAARSTAGYLHRTRGCVEQSIAMFEESLALVEQFKILIWRRPTAGELAHAYALSGRPAEARSLIERALAGNEENSTPLTAMMISLGEAHLREGRADEAAAVADKALARARAQGEKFHEAGALRLCGAVAAVRSPLEAAVASYQSALVLADAQGYRPLAALCHRGLAGLARRGGDEAGTDAHRRSASALCLTMDLQIRPHLLGPEFEAE